MPQITLTIKGYTFQLVAPYEPDMPMGIAEAGILNREWTQAVRTGFQQTIEHALIRFEGQLDNATIASLQIDFQHYADEFAFKALSQTRISDPLTLQKHAVAKQILDIRLNAAGATRQTYGEHRYETVLARLMNNPEVIRQAELNIAQSRAAADELAGMEDLASG